MFLVYRFSVPNIDFYFRLFVLVLRVYFVVRVVITDVCLLIVSFCFDRPFVAGLFFGIRRIGKVWVLEEVAEF